MLNTAYPIKTERLLLRPFADRDLDDVLAFQSREDVTRYLYWSPRDRVEVGEVLKGWMALPPMDADGQSLVLAAELQEANRVIGSLFLFLRSVEHRQGEIGFVFNPDYQGRGLATEGTIELLRLGFEGLNLHRLCGRCDARNQASAKLMERLGMRPEAHLIQNERVKGEWTDELVYAILAEEWWSRVGGRG
ncbi:MAG: GNAT family protein [Candidatus Dormiibacterota bacterium]